MVTVITLVSNREGFDNLKRNIVSFESDWKIGLDILCIVSDYNLYLECRNFLHENVDKGECLVVYEQDATLKSGKEYLDWKNEYVFLLAENVRVPSGGITKLYKTYLEKPQAGFITGEWNLFPTVRWVKDIYGAPKYIYSNEPSPYGLRMDIDVAEVYGIMTKTNLYKELFCLDNLDGYGSHSFGIRLRRQGYKNYINTGVEYKYGGNE